MSNFVQFFLASLKNPLQTSTLVETGPRVAERFTRHLALRDDELVVELGVGAGAITRHLLPKLKNPKAYVGFELNDDLFKFLETRFPELEIHHASAENLASILKGRKVGAVISTLPWSLLSRESRRTILSEIHNVLVPGGVFATFVSLHVMWTASARDFLEQLRLQFPELHEETEVKNIPPCRIFVARKS